MKCLSYEGCCKVIITFTLLVSDFIFWKMRWITHRLLCWFCSGAVAPDLGVFVQHTPNAWSIAESCLQEINSPLATAVIGDVGRQIFRNVRHRFVAMFAFHTPNLEVRLLVWVFFRKVNPQRAFMTWHSDVELLGRNFTDNSNGNFTWIFSRRRKPNGPKSWPRYPSHSMKVDRVSHSCTSVGPGDFLKILYKAVGNVY